MPTQIALIDPPPSIQPTNPDQQFLINSGFLTSPYSGVLVLPPGSGKTYLSQIAVNAALQTGGRVLFLAPTKALGNQQYERLKAIFPNVHAFNGDRERDNPDDLTQAQVLIATPEWVDKYLRSPRRINHPWLLQLRLLVVDEIHTIGEGRRGATLERVIVLLQLVNPFIRVLGLSGTLDANDLADWLDMGHYTNLNASNPPTWEVHVCQWKQKNSTLLGILKSPNHRGGTIIFCQSRRRCDDVVQWLRSRGISAQSHHAGRSKDERAEIEQGFNEQSVVVATGTLAVGVDLAARSVILYDLSRMRAPLPAAEVHQLAGRCTRGRIPGTVYLLATHQEEGLAWDYQQAAFEPLQSPMQGIHQEELGLIAIAGGYANNQLQLERLTHQTFAHYQGVAIDAVNIIQQLLNKGLIERDNDALKPTRIGKLTVSKYLQVDSLVNVAWYIQPFTEAGTLDRLTYLDWLLLVGRMPECYQLMVPKGVDETLAQWVSQQPSLLLANGTMQAVMAGDELQRLLFNGAVLRTLTQKGLQETLWQWDIPYQTDLEELRHSAQKALDVLIDLLSVLAGKSIAQCQKLYNLAQMLKLGLDERALSLMTLTHVGRRRAPRLLAAGINRPEQLGQLSPQALRPHMKLSLQQCQETLDSATTAMPPLLDDPTVGTFDVGKWKMQQSMGRLRAIAQFG